MATRKRTVSIKSLIEQVNRINACSTCKYIRVRPRNVCTTPVSPTQGIRALLRLVDVRWDAYRQGKNLGFRVRKTKHLTLVKVNDRACLCDILYATLNHTALKPL